MRAVTIALAAIPVVFGGLGLAAISGALDPLMPPSTVADDSHLGPDATHTSESAANSGTSIDGRRPHLSVIDGYANFALPVHISGILSLLPVADADLAPLPSAEGRDDDTESAGTSWNAPDEASPHVGTPAAPVAPPVRDYSPSGAEPTIANQAPSPSRPMPPTLPSHSPLGGGGGDWQRPIQESLRAPESQASRTEEQISNARPPHAGVPGRPPHADTQGPPAHAADNNGRSDNGNPGNSGNGNGNGNGNSGNSGNGNSGNGNGNSGQGRFGTDGAKVDLDSKRPDHAGGPGGPDGNARSGGR
ncbi:hypothetical protein G6016_15560 [Dietzia aerolata]|uniref:Uncharacterized protein n=1 Tax=Dietzia aerolata TaxID=595984 RepID=A0ABV5JUL9_9ACTN|nr:hypothetical protein [Dietzia aerolata]MBB0970347.1 hypothetical protein [Dietzia aerolata]